MFIRGGANNRVFVRKVPIVWPGGVMAGTLDQQLSWSHRFDFSHSTFG